MKLRHLPTLCAALLALCPTLSIAQTSAVPGFISYQGRVVDGAGANVGKDTPVNRTVIFRIWDNPSSTNAANLIYSEAQTVTVSEGEFSVLVGQGVANLTQTFGYSESGPDKKLADFSTAFNGSARYLGVTVAAAATIATTDNEITPRQQIVSTAFAMRAKFAESIGSSSDLTLNPLSGTASNYGLGWYGTGRLFGTTAVDGPVLYGNAGGALGSNASGTYNTALRWDASGRVGIGATSLTSTTNKLTLQGDMATSPADQLTIRGNADNNKRLLLGYDTTLNQGTLQSYSGATAAGTLLLNAAGGNVGINSVNPTANLTIRSGKNGWPNTSGDTSSASAAGLRLFGSDNVMLDSGVNSSRGAWLQTTDQTNMATTYPLILNPNGGNVGVGTTSPSHALTVGGNPGDAQSVNIRSYGTGTVNSWKGSGAFGGSNATVIMGELEGVAQIGGHTPTLNGWKDLAINSAGGNVGIGTRTPAAKLDVAGDIKSSGKTVTVGEESLRIIRGNINAEGVPIAGNGYTVERSGSEYIVSFSTPFAGEPSVTCSGFNSEPIMSSLTGLTNSYFRVIFGTSRTSGFFGYIEYINRPFSFIAIGPR